MSDRIIDLYQRHARTWAVRRGERLIETGWLERFRTWLPTAGSVLDLGCGSGVPIARYFIERGHAVTGIDSAPTMIAMASERFPTQQWLVADMRDLSLDRAFHGILAWDSFFHLNHADQHAMFATFRAHATPGAPLMFTSGPSHGEAIGSFEGEPLYHASLDSAVYRDLLDRHGFDTLAHTVEDPACGGRTVWLARRRTVQAGR